MLTYCLKCQENTNNINSKSLEIKSKKLMLISKCAICNSTKSRFIKEQQAKGLLSNLGIKTPFNKVPLLGDILF